MGYTVHRILQARGLQWVAYPFSRGSSPPRNWSSSAALQADSLPTEAPGKPRRWLAFGWDAASSGFLYMQGSSLAPLFGCCICWCLHTHNLLCSHDKSLHLALFLQTCFGYFWLFIFPYSLLQSPCQVICHTLIPTRVVRILFGSTFNF